MATHQGSKAAFRPGSLAVIRLATLPWHCAEPTLADLEPDRDGYEQRLVSYLTGLTADPLVREAIAVSSSSLADVLRRLEAGEELARARLERATFAITRYVLRMASRPTPFGLLAGVQQVSFGDSASVVWTGRHQKSVRPDNSWLSAVLADLQRQPAVREACQVVVNNLCVVRGNRLVLPYVRKPADANAEAKTEQARDAELSVQQGPALSVVLDLARRPVRYVDLRTNLVDRFGGTINQIDQFLGSLINKEFLLTDLLCRRDVPDRLGTAADLLRGVDSAGVDDLQSVGKLLRTYENLPAGTGLDAWHEATTTMAKLKPSPTAPPVQVDLRMGAEIRLPTAVADELAAVGTALWRLAPSADLHPELTEYHNAFLERFGTNVLVPLVDLLDPHRGLGPPAGYRVPASERNAPPQPASYFTVERDRILGARLLDVLTSGGDELVLDDDLVDQLSHDESKPPGVSFDICVEVLAESADALDRGDYRMRLTTGAGSVAAGAMAGRFAELLDVDEALATLVAEHDETGTAPLVAQLYHQPKDPRHDNVALVPQLLPHIVPVGTFADPDAPGVIDPRQLYVGATMDRFYLRRPDDEREVVVVTPHMLEFRRTAPNIARFLSTIAISGSRPWGPWQWGRLDVLPYLPRVRYGRTILEPARWIPPATLRDQALSWPDWCDGLKRWREASKVPSRVRITTFDNFVELDLTAPLHQRLLRNHIAHNERAAVVEASPGGAGWLDGHACEVVLPLVSRRPRAPLPRSKALRTNGTLHPPGGEWLSAKVYAHSTSHVSLLRREIATLAGQLPPGADRWYFLRYADPERHLRLRFHGPAGQLNGELLPVLHSWARRCTEAGLIRDLVIDGYRPETARYGGPDSIDAAERLFQADSEAVLVQLHEHSLGRLAVPVEVLAAANYVDLLSSLGSWDWPSWVLAHFSDGSKRGLREVREMALKYVDVQGDWRHLSSEPGGGTVLAAWAKRAVAAASYGTAVGLDVDSPEPIGSLLHMHANRLLGLNRDLELRSYGILRTVVHSNLARQRQGR